MERSSLRGEGFSPPHNVRPAPCAGMEAALGQHGVYRGRFIWLALQVLAGQRLWGAEPPPVPHWGPRGQFPTSAAPSWPCPLAQLIPAHSLF